MLYEVITMLDSISEAFTYRCETKKLVNIEDEQKLIDGSSIGGLEINEDTNLYENDGSKPKIIYHKTTNKESPEDDKSDILVDKDGNRCKESPLFESIEHRMSYNFV